MLIVASVAFVVVFVAFIKTSVNNRKLAQELLDIRMINTLNRRETVKLRTRLLALGVNDETVPLDFRSKRV